MVSVLDRGTISKRGGAVSLGIGAKPPSEVCRGEREPWLVEAGGERIQTDLIRFLWWTIGGLSCGVMDKPVMRSVTEFSDYLALHLGMVRTMRHLSRDDEYLVGLDKLMSERWASVINGRCPSPQQREVALRERENVANLYPRVRVATCELLVGLRSLQAYVNALPVAGSGGGGGGWAVREDLVHPDNLVKMLSSALEDAKGLHGLDEENGFFKGLLDQLLEMARWTRTSLNPPAEDRAKVRVGGVAQEELDVELRKVLEVVCRSLHDFCELYAGFPTLAPVVKMGVERLPWDR
jgi:hypothetical protein